MKTKILLVVMWAAFAAGLVFLLGLAGFITYSAFPYLWQSFTLPRFVTAGEKAGAFCMAICSLVTAIFLVFCSVKMTIIAVRTSKKMLTKFSTPKSHDEPDV